MQAKSKFAVSSLIMLSFSLVFSINQASAAPDDEAVFKQIEDAVKKTYPHVKFSKIANSLHFESKIKNLVGYYSKDKVKVPDAGGIMGDITVEAGEYSGKDKNHLSVEINEGVMTTLKLAPYSKSENNHLLAKLYFPLDTTYDFKEEMKKIIKSYGSHASSDGTLSKDELHKAASDESQKDVSNWVETSSLSEQLQLAREAMSRHNFEGARRHYRAAALISPSQYEFYPQYYDACVKTGFWGEAENVAARLVKTSDANERLYIEKYANALVAARNPEKAQVVLRRAIELANDGRQKIRLYHALLQIAINKHDDSMIESTCEELLKVSPDEDDVRVRLLEIRKKKKS